MGKNSKRAKHGADSKPHQPAPLCKDSNKYIRKLKEHLLQPSRKHYGGMGYAKESVFLQLDDPDYDAKFGDIWEEHIAGFSGKYMKQVQQISAATATVQTKSRELQMQSFKKRKSAAEDGMLWKQRLKAKQATIQQPLGQAKGSTKNSRGQAKPLKHTDTDRTGQRLSSQQNAKLSVQLSVSSMKPQKSKKKTAPQPEQATAAQLQVEAIAAYRQLKKARRMQT